MSVAAELDREIAGQVAQYYADPLGFVMFAYPLREKGGALQDYVGPDKCQADTLREIGRQVVERKFDGINAVAPIRYGVSSGHGIGKTMLLAWVVDWIMSTRPDCKGTVTANTAVQLETKTWAAIRYWTKLSVTSHWFGVTSSLNKRTLQAEERIERLKCDSFEVMALIALNDLPCCVCRGSGRTKYQPRGENKELGEQQVGPQP